MKKIIAILFLGWFSFAMIAQQSQGLQINANTIIKDPQGNRVTMETFVTYMDSKEWSLEPKVTENGTQYIQLIKLTKEEQQAMVASRIPKNNFNGNTMPYFNLVDRKGNIISSDTTRDKVVVFNFWFTSCPPCIQEIPELNEVYKKYKNRNDIVFAAITFEKEEKIKKFQAKYNLQYPIIGSEGDFSQSISRGAYPTNVIIGRDGKIQEYISGGMQGIGKQIEAAIKTAL